MARYIDADLLLERIYPYNGVDKSKYAINAKAVFEAIRKSPTVDVVPKSEVAMIFEELYKSVVSKIPPHIRPIFKDDMDFEDGFRNGKTDALLDVLVLIAELKKKYTNN